MASNPLLDALSICLEACIHQLLHNRGVYPNELFDRTKLFSIPVHRMRSVEVCEYIRSMVTSCKDWMQRDLVEALVLQITDARSGQMLENFIFELQSTSALCNVLAPDVPELAVQLEAILRAFLIKSTQAGATLGGKCESLPQNNETSFTSSILPSTPDKPPLPLSWKVLLLTYEVEEGESLLSAMPWVEADSDQLSSPEPTLLSPLRSHTIPTKGIETFKLQFFAEKLQSAMPVAQNVEIEKK